MEELLPTERKKGRQGQKKQKPPDETPKSI
jgi:hypothetical protein